MRIEAKKYKYSINKNTGTRPMKSGGTESVSGTSAEKKSRLKLPKISIPKIRLPRIRRPGIEGPDFTISRFQDQKRGGRPALYFVAVLAGVPLLIVAVWLGMNLISRPVPDPLFTERDLPRILPAGSNGYTLLHDGPDAAEYGRKDIGNINLFRNAASLDAFLDPARGEYEMAKSLAARDDVRKMMRLYREIMARQVFADTGMPRADERGDGAFAALYNSMTATLMARLQEKKQGAAFVILRDQIKLSMQYVMTARSMDNFRNALSAYDRLLDVLESMLKRSGGSLGPEALSACNETGSMLRSFNPRVLSLDRIVIYEYILSWKRAFDPAKKDPEASVLRGMKYRKLAFFDRGDTRRLYDDRWKELYDYAKNPDDQALAEIMKKREGRFAAGGFWWFHNAAGKKYLDAIPMPVYQLFPDARSRGDNIVRKQGEILAKIDALEEPAPGKKAVKGKR
ncbi:MAG: hypothetical protein JXA07_04675 [Spirochaetes bacterium]|nr:hypothetical protein [Spirochaetota bacterium]